MEDAGQYKLHAKNSFGESNATITLNFDSEEAGQVSGGLGAPTFIQKPLIRQLEDRILFECKLTADPAPSFLWSFHGSSLKSQAKYKQRIVSEGPVHILILEIDHLTGADSGDYKCHAKNEHGEADSIIKLNIETSRGAK